MKAYDDYLLNMSNEVNALVSECKKISYNKDSINIYCINKDSSISVKNNIPNVSLHDIEKGNGSIIVYYDGTTFVNCHISLRNECVVIIKYSKNKINKLSILNHNGDRSVCFINENFSCNGAEIRLWDYKNVYIGKDVMFSWEIMLFTSDGHTILDKYGEIINKPEDVVIGDHVWIGHGVKILKGTFINKNTVVGESSIVTRKYYDENIILSGIPARILKTGISWDRRRLFNNK